MEYTSLASVILVSLALTAFLTWIFFSDDEDKWKF